MELKFFPYKRKKEVTFTKLKKRKEVLDFIRYNNQSISSAANYFGIPRTTISYWVKTEDKIRKKDENKLSIHPGRKLKFQDYEKTVYDWIIYNRSLKLPINMYAIDKKFSELCPEFAKDVQGTRISRIYRFLIRNNLSIRKPTHVGSIIHDDIIDVVNKFYINLRKDLKFMNFDKDLIGNMDETPIFFNMNINGIVERKGNKNIIVKTQNQENMKISVILCILANGQKLPPFVIFRGSRKSKKIRSKLDELDIVKSKKVFYDINENAWCTGEVMKSWIKNVWIRYINSLGFTFQSLLFIDHASTHLKSEISSLLIKNDVIAHYIPKGLTGLMQPLDVSVNKGFKDALRKKYVDYCIDINQFQNKKVTKIQMLNWINDIWNNKNMISEKIIKKSFLVTGLVNKDEELSMCRVYPQLKERMIPKESEIKQENKKTKKEEEKRKKKVGEEKKEMKEEEYNEEIDYSDGDDYI